MLGAKDGLFDEYNKKYGSRYRLWLGKHLFIVLTEVEDIEVVLSNSKTLGKPDAFMVFKDFFGDSLPFASVPLWKTNRKSMQPFFGKNVLRSHITEMNRIIYQFIEDMKSKVNGGEFDLTDHMNFMSFDTISKTHFNFQLNQQEKEEVKFHRIIETALEISSIFMFFSWLHNKFIRDLMFKKKMNEIKKKTIIFMNKLMSQNLEEAEKNVDNLETAHNLTSEIASKSLLFLLRNLEDRTGTEKYMYHEMMNTLAAGTETTATAVASFLLAVAMYPEIQEKVYEEIYEVFGDDDRPADEGDLDKFPYMDQVMKESLRIFTLVPHIFRKVDEDMKIGPYVYPAGTSVLVDILNVHFDPKLYPNPKQFNPENFSPEAISKRHKYSYLPFSAGARNCIGKSFAELGMKLRLIALLRMFSFHTTMKMEDMKFANGIVAHSVKGYPVSLKWRKKKPSTN
nr:farnesyl diphosphate synthase [Kerria lacca]